MSTTPSPHEVGCPTTRQLREWLDGGKELSESIQQHIENCQRCSASLAAMTDDESLHSLADRSQTKPRRLFSDEPEFENLRSLLNAWSLDGLSQLDSGDLTPPEARESDVVHPPPRAGELVSTQRAKLESTHLDSPSLQILSTDMLSRRLPVGRYVIERLIASGGAGAVYLAYDQRLQREVAIKILARESMRDRQRFLREARTLADLEHPNVVRIFDFGALEREVDRLNVDPQLEQSGQLYLVMEYLSGGTSAKLGFESTLQNSENSAVERKANDLKYFRNLASLLATAADGLAAAHAKGLVHRDVKPGNLLLNADRTAIKVADFGLARLSDADATQVTRTGDLLGTPVFMSPEQVSVNSTITSASDTYSLGATLYQLMTGIAPFQGGPAAVLRQVAESSPVAPRLINAAIPFDLETICLHAMEHEPASRYPSMEQFAADLRRFVAGEPIAARPVSSTTKVMRFLRRNPSFTSILVTCIVLVCLLTAGSATAAYVYYHQNQNLEMAANSERRAKRSAEEALKASIAAADDLLLAVTTESDLLPRTPGSQEVVRKLLERARDYFQRFLETNEGNVTLTYQLARAHSGLGVVAMRVGDAATLEAETEAAIALIDLIPSTEIPESKRAELKCDTLVVLANYYIEAGEAKRAIPILLDAIQTCESVDEQAGDEADEESPDGLAASHATALMGLANAYTWVGKRDESIPLLTTAKEMFVKLRSGEPDNQSYLRNAAACHMTLATIALDLNKATEAKLHLADALVLLNEVDENDAISLRVREMKIKVFTNLALAERRMGNNVAAKAGYEAAMEESQRMIELEPSITSHQWNLVVASLNSGGPDIELGTLQSLVERWQATVPVLDRLIAGEPDNQRYQQVKAMLQSNIAIVLRDMGKLEEAIVPLQAATESLRQHAQQLDFSSEAYLPVALNHYELASTWLQLKQYEKTTTALAESDAIVNAILASDPDFTPARGHLLDALHMRLAMLAVQKESDLAQRDSLAEQSLGLAQELARNNPDVAEYQIELPRALNDHALVLADASQFEAALTTAREARQLLATLLSKSDSASVPPELGACEKAALLVEVRAMLHSAAEPNSPQLLADVHELLNRAREFGATDEELAGFDEFFASSSK